MPANIVDISNFDDPVTAPSDSDAGLASGELRNTVQKLADRTRYLYDKWFNVVVSLAALKALTGMTNGEKRFVRGHGWYEFRASDLAVEISPWILEPSAFGAGRWYHELADLLAANLGIATLSSTGKLVQAVPNRMMQFASDWFNDYTTNSATQVDVSGASIALGTAGVVGDLVHVTAHFGIQAVGAGLVDIVVTEAGGADVPVSGAGYTYSGGTTPAFRAGAIGGVHPVGNPGAIVVKLRARGDGTNNCTVYAPGLLTATHMRP
jgi:hypothetical protein